MPLETHHSIASIGQTRWDQLRPPHSPFLNYHFLHALEQSGSVGDMSGQRPLYFVDYGGPGYQNDAGPAQEQELGPGCILLTSIKQHSYGEYIFDWGWAELYRRLSRKYYPKLTSMIPFTPVTTPHFLMPRFEIHRARRVLQEHENYFADHSFSSAHFLFLTAQERPLFQEQRYLLRESLQYHFLNEDYQSFEDFLGRLKNKKAKQIRKERHFPQLRIERLTGDQLNLDHAKTMYQFYLSTITQKKSLAYLNLDFFQRLFTTLANHVLYVQASRDGTPVAGAIFLYDNRALYGRYWGCRQSLPNLHFELCYYQGIEFCIESRLQVFEAGAQGEHKIARGFRPTRIFSAHKLKDPLLGEIIAASIIKEKQQIQLLQAELNQLLPFRGGLL